MVRAWIWNLGADAPRVVPGIELRVGYDDPPIAWIGNDRVALVAWDIGAEKSGDFYFRILRGRNVADGWKRAMDERTPSVSILDSGGRAAKAAPSGRLVSLNLQTNAQTTLARGGIHRISVSKDQRFIAFLREEPGIPSQRVATFFAPTKDEDTLYDAVNWGTARHVIDSRTGAEVEASSMPEAAATEESAPAAKSAAPVDLPRRDARRKSSAPGKDAALFTADAATDGSHLWICGGAGRPMTSCKEIWKANEWTREIKPATSELIDYQAIDGTPLKAWLVLPPDYAAGTKLPVVTIVYPGTTYDAESARRFSLFDADFEHPQLFAALGYAVLLPSMPEPKDPTSYHSLTTLTNGVLPAIDAVIARGIADPDRIAVIGQSAGGFATQGLITQTTRFRSAIASAGFSDLVSFYGTFYGQYRYGDAGAPQTGQVLRMLQFEKGYGNLGGPPWVQSERYRADSAVLLADKVETPILLIHGDIDFVPIKQDEELFTALYRQDKRAEFLRYQGEWHTISKRANVLDMWKHIGEWLAETMAPR